MKKSVTLILLALCIFIAAGCSSPYADSEALNNLSAKYDELAETSENISAKLTDSGITEEKYYNDYNAIAVDAELLSDQINSYNSKQIETEKCNELTASCEAIILRFNDFEKELDNAIDSLNAETQTKAN